MYKMKNPHQWSIRMVLSIYIIYINNLWQHYHPPNHFLTQLTTHSSLPHSVINSRSHYLILPHPLNHALLKTPHPPLTHPTILSLLPSLTQSLRHCFINLVTHSITSSLNHSSTYSSARSIIPSPTHSITHSITPSLILHSFIHSAMHFFTDSTTRSWVWKGRAALLGFPVCVYFCFVKFISLYPLHNEVVGGYIGFTPSVRLSVHPSRVRPASRVRSVVPTVLVGSISYLYILSNSRKCVACKVSCKISKFEFLAFFLNL